MTVDNICRHLLQQKSCSTSVLEFKLYFQKFSCRYFYHIDRSWSISVCKYPPLYVLVFVIGCQHERIKSLSRGNISHMCATQTCSGRIVRTLIYGSGAVPLTSCGIYSASRGDITLHACWTSKLCLINLEESLPFPCVTLIALLNHTVSNGMVWNQNFAPPHP